MRLPLKWHGCFGAMRLSPYCTLRSKTRLQCSGLLILFARITQRLTFPCARIVVADSISNATCAGEEPHMHRHTLEVASRIATLIMLALAVADLLITFMA